MRSGRVRKVAKRTGQVVVPLVIVALLPPVQARFKAIGVLAEALGTGFPRPFAREVQRRAATIGGVEGVIYLPGGAAPGVLLVHGAAPKGANDPRLVRTARAIAASNRVVFVPSLQLAQRRFENSDIERIADSVQGLAAHTDVSGPVSVVGISYGGSFALIAAARDGVQDDIAQISLFGAYFDLIGVVQAATTGVSLVGGERTAWDADPRAREVLNVVAERLLRGKARTQFRSALDGSLAPEELPPSARAVYELLQNEDPERTFELANNLSVTARRVLEAFSPSSVAGDIGVPIIALHSTDDPTVPYGEALRLRDALPQTDLYTVNLFKHVELGRSVASWSAALDLVTAWRFVSRMLSAQE